MEMLIHFNTLPQDLTLDAVKSDLALLLEDDGWLIGSGEHHIELELEDEKANPKYGILTVKGYLQKAKFTPDTTIELAGVPVGIYE
ncbi:hypothetical protein [Intestinimonas sp. HCP28S3_D6]|uniref:hypothetical protein n=1 Tax=Intestinimonas sp. HCP28S3_D6 TaxID=3438942 RepID=UPI003F88D5BD